MPAHVFGLGSRGRGRAVAVVSDAVSSEILLTASFVLAGGLVLAPWAIRNACVFDRFIVTTTHGGYTLWLGNNPEFYRFLEQSQWGDVWDSRHLDEQYLRVRHQYGNDELLADRWAYDQAVADISHEPASFLRACVFRVSSLWGVVPHRVTSTESAAKRLARYAVGVWYAVVLVLALVGAGILGRRLYHPPWLWGSCCACRSPRCTPSTGAICGCERR